jgi:hypothetical protein
MWGWPAEAMPDEKFSNTKNLKIAQNIYIIGNL